MIKISVLIPTYNRKDFLKQALVSVLNQDYVNFEIIVSDNASTDGTYDEIKPFINSHSNVRYYKNNENIGMVLNWRKCLYEYASGDYFLILSDDDYLVKNNYFSQAVNLIEQNKDISIVYANGMIFNETRKKFYNLVLPFSGAVDGKNVFLSRGHVKPVDFTLCNVLFNKAKSLELNAFSNKFNVNCDSELFLKLCLLGKVGVVNDSVSVYRVHSSRLTENRRKDFDITINLLDYLFNPYIFAKDNRLLTKTELINWEKIVHCSFRDVLLDVLFYNKKRYSETVDIIKNKSAGFENPVWYKTDLIFNMMNLLSRLRSLI